jgi:A/G-specific adenine glycosylase
MKRSAEARGKDAQRIGRDVLAWYDIHARDLPWRIRDDRTPNPYHVWLSEIMLQQTTVAAVIPYFRDFLHRWPSISDLARAPDDAVMAAWAGLGYYARARNLLACARVVERDHGGQFPREEAALINLPGIGPYTAAAIAAIAFNQPSAPIDGNIERVMSRLFRLTTPLPHLKAEVHTTLSPLVPHHRPGDFAQALMDLGATICTPKAPSCVACPLAAYCAGRDIAATLPRRSPKAEKPLRRGEVLWIYDRRGRVLMRRRPKSGLLGGMLEFPSHGWDPKNNSERRQFAIDRWQTIPGSVKHVFTHFELHLTVAVAHGSARLRHDLPGAEDYVWLSPTEMEREALPSVMRKIAHHVEHHLAR